MREPVVPGYVVDVEHECDGQPCTAPVEVLATDPFHESFSGACSASRYEVEWSL